MREWLTGSCCVNRFRNRWVNVIFCITVTCLKKYDVLVPQLLMDVALDNTLSVYGESGVRLKYGKTSSCQNSKYGKTSLSKYIRDNGSHKCLHHSQCQHNMSTSTQCHCEQANAQWEADSACRHKEAAELEPKHKHSSAHNHSLHICEPSRSCAGETTNTIKYSTLQTLKSHVQRTCTPHKRTKRQSKTLHMASFQNECTAKQRSRSACTGTPNNGTKQHSTLQALKSHVERMCTPNKSNACAHQAGTTV